ncbi:hypothetical protein [Allobaculum mucilyticum]|uniref:hypothetical protein n=1 Tax=Allobaculum mucilyticum TaxID=2834459 RepID=UPI001E43C9E9|nr:hypothetical protein [Allobaculum mucilyticum]UNT95026.1 hypothetical protein KWG62_06510 [Allobaculum mucilyticum]
MKKFWEFCLRHPYWIAFLAAFIPRVIFALGINMMSISGDEIFSFWPAAKLAGYDWSGVMSGYRYYGFGYTAVLVPFFLLIRNPAILYKTLVSLMVLFQSLAAPIASHLMKRFFHVKKVSLIIIAGIVCSYCVGLRAVYTYPEFLYDFLVWIIVWILLILTEKPSLKWTVILWALTIYACTVHSRGVTLVFAILAAAALYQFWFRKPLVNWWATIVLAIAALLLYRFGIQFVLNFLGVGHSVSNTSVTVRTGALSLLTGEPKSWISWFYIILGQLNEGIMMSVGLAVPAVWILLKMVFSKVQRTEKNRGILCVTVFGLTAIVITIGGQSFSSLYAVYEAMFNNGDWDAFRTITYLRYYAAYASPLLLAAICAFRNRNLLYSILVPSIVTSVLLQGLFVILIVPYINHFNGSVWSYAPFFGSRGFVDNISTAAYLAGTFAVLLLQVVYLILLKKKLRKMILPLAAAVMVYVYGFNCINHEGYRSRQNAQAIEQGVDYLNEHSIHSNIYVANVPAGSAGQGVAWLYQYALPDATVQEYTSIPQEENAVVITNTDSDENLLDKGFKPSTLNDGWFIYERYERN